MQPTMVTIPARRGKAAQMRQGQKITVVNTHGSQVVDTWAFNTADLTEWMSMEHSRAYYLKLRRRHFWGRARHAHGGLRQCAICAPRL